MLRRIYGGLRGIRVRTRSTTTRDRNLQFRRAVSTGGSPLDFFAFSPVFMCNLARRAPQNLEKAAKKSSGENRVKSCHVCGCHGFVRPWLSGISRNKRGLGLLTTKALFAALSGIGGNPVLFSFLHRSMLLLFGLRGSTWDTQAYQRISCLLSLIDLGCSDVRVREQQFERGGGKLSSPVKCYTISASAPRPL